MLHDESAQATVEYAGITAGLLIASVPLAAFLPRFIDAFNIYLHSYYLILTLPFP